ncbi:hypothetical protein TYRP_012052 [Tyrophagus putrescentiae]|nr:hypothetical protein TYRP_012052 [Tyrophagus putrescentiae]
MEQKMRLAALVAGALNILFCALCIYFTRALFTGHDADFWLHLQIFATGSTSLAVQVVGLYGIVRRGASAVRIQLYTLVALSLFFVIRAFANVLFWLFVGWNFALLFVLLNYLNEAKREARLLQRRPANVDVAAAAAS